MTLKAVDSTSPLEGGINQRRSVEDLVHALLAPFAQKKEREADQEFSAITLAFIDWWRSLSENRKREFLRSLTKLTNRWLNEPDWDYGFCFTCVYYKGKGKCRAGCSPVEANKRQQCGTWRVL